MACCNCGSRRSDADQHCDIVVKPARIFAGSDGLGIVQGYPELEYIVVDPGSTDGSRELIESYQDRVTQKIFEPDRGAADGLKRVFRGPPGKYLDSSTRTTCFYLDRSNWWPLFREAPGMRFGVWRRIQDRWRGTERPALQGKRFHCEAVLLWWNPMVAASRLFPGLSLSSPPRFNLENRTCWDGELFVNIANQGANIGYIDGDLAGFRIHDASISGSGRMQKQFQEDCRRIFRQIRGHDWRVTDEALRFLYRAEGLLIRLGARIQQIKKVQHEDRDALDGFVGLS